MKQPVITVCNYVDVIGSYCYTPSLLHSYLCNQKIVTYVLQTLYYVIINVSTQTSVSRLYLSALHVYLYCPPYPAAP